MITSERINALKRERLLQFIQIKMQIVLNRTENIVSFRQFQNVLFLKVLWRVIKCAIGCNVSKIKNWILFTLRVNHKAQ